MVFLEKDSWKPPQEKSRLPAWEAAFCTVYESILLETPVAREGHEKLFGIFTSRPPCSISLFGRSAKN